MFGAEKPYWREGNWTMRQSIGKTNRAWLAIIGVAGIILGALMLLISTGLIGTVPAQTGIRELPEPSAPVIPVDVTTIFDPVYVAVVLIGLGIILAILGLVWMLAQIPRKNAARAYRLRDEASPGITTCDPGILSDAVEEQVKALPGVTNADVLLRGTANTPELTVEVTTNDRADLQDVLDRIQTTVVHDLSTTLEAPLHRLAVRCKVGATNRNNESVVL